MSGSLNKWMGIGNLCRDPETRSMQDGSKVVNFTIACNETWRDKQSGERKERAEYVRIVVFNERIADVAEKYLKKGSKVYLEGQLQTRSYDKNGTTVYTTEVVLQRYRGELTMLDGRGDAAGAQEQQAGGGDLDDEIPFAPLRELP